MHRENSKENTKSGHGLGHGLYPGHASKPCLSLISKALDFKTSQGTHGLTPGRASYLCLHWFQFYTCERLLEGCTAYTHGQVPSHGRAPITKLRSFLLKNTTPSVFKLFQSVLITSNTCLKLVYQHTSTTHT